MSAPASPSRTSPVTWIAMIAAVALGASTAYYAVEARAARRAADGAKATKVGTGAAVVPVAEERGASDEVRRLRAENLELVRRLMEREAGGKAVARPDGGVLRTWMDRLEEMKKNDPERYKRMMERREQRRADMEASREEQLARLDQRLEALGAADTPEAKKEAELLNKIAAVMSELAQLGDKLQALANLPDSERQAQAQALGQKARELYTQLGDLRAEDRRNQLNALAGQLGLNADQAGQMTSSVDRIVKETDAHGMRPRGPGGAMGGRRRPP